MPTHPVRRVAVLSDVHGNLPALEAVTTSFDSHRPRLATVRTSSPAAVSRRPAADPSRHPRRVMVATASAQKGMNKWWHRKRTGYRLPGGTVRRCDETRWER